MVYAADIRDRLAMVASGNLALDDFEQWIAENAWNVHVDSPPDAAQLASRIGLIFDARDDGVYSEEDVHRELRLLWSTD